MTHAVITNENAGIKLFRLDTVIRALKLEVETGLKLTSRMPKVRDLATQYGCESRTKKGLLQELVELRSDIDEGLFDPMGLPG